MWGGGLISPVEAHQDEDARLRALLAAFQDVKPENQPILRRVWRLLGEVVRFSDVNQMGESNLGSVLKLPLPLPPRSRLLLPHQ